MPPIGHRAKGINEDGTERPSATVTWRSSDPKIATVDRFGFVAPQGAKKLEALAVDEAGELTASEESK